MMNLDGTLVVVECQQNNVRYGLLTTDVFALMDQDQFNDILNSNDLVFTGYYRIDLVRVTLIPTYLVLLHFGIEVGVIYEPID